MSMLTRRRGKLTDSQLEDILQNHTLIYKDGSAYLRHNKTGEIMLIPSDIWKLSFKRLYKLLDGFIGILVISKTGYEIYKSTRGGARVIKNPNRDAILPEQKRELTADEKAEIEIRKWASRLGLGVSILKNARVLYDLYKWYKG